MKKILLFSTLFLCGCYANSQKHYEEILRLFNIAEYQEAIVYIDKYKNEIIKPELLYSTKGMERRIKDTLISIAVREIQNGGKSEIYLGFKLGSTEREYNNYAKSLILKNELYPKTTITSTIGFGSYADKINTSGYKHIFYIKDFKCTAILVPKFAGNELISLEVCLFSIGDGEKCPTTPELKDIYDNKYGAPEMKQVINLYYSDEDQKNIEYFWRDSNIAVILYKVGGFTIINYVNLNIKGLINDLKNAEKESNLNKSKEQLNKI